MFKNRRVIFENRMFLVQKTQSNFFENHLFLPPSPWVEENLNPRGGGTNLKVKGLNL